MVEACHRLHSKTNGPRVCGPLSLLRLESGSWNYMDVNGSGMHAASTGCDDGCKHGLVDCAR